jgi:phage tail-like protein
MPDVTTDPAVTVCFSVSVDGHDLGVFSQCDGLGLEITIEQREEGGQNGFVHQLPGRVKFTNVKLTRPINRDSRNVVKWFASMRGNVRHSTAHISARTIDGTVVATWSLHGVIPVKWTGPQLNVDSPKVATETIELAHHGFLT